VSLLRSWADSAPSGHLKCHPAAMWDRHTVQCLCVPWDWSLLTTAGACASDNAFQALKLLGVMWTCGGELVPDIVSYNTVMKACGNAQQTDRAFEVGATAASRHQVCQLRLSYASCDPLCSCDLRRWNLLVTKGPLELESAGRLAPATGWVCRDASASTHVDATATISNRQCC
jgi:hypothetical protein